MEEIIDGYQKAESIHFDNLNSHQQLHCEIAKIRHETDRLQLSLKQITGEDLTGLTVNDLNQLEEQLEFSVNKVRTRKVMMEQQQEIEEDKIREMGFLEPLGQFLDFRMEDLKFLKAHCMLSEYKLLETLGIQ
ncbi:hypothetical protein IEQ34_017897 [Dendrobium chrysotoxum]|uniref:K-box domain-containing protein n=1 Tax=Dendrobium chrysotoxum TaxID=161865 RepID=A0AAV7GDU6_DENCH|nr:hypothetical protein IEQ34_017897 [Dendrobium chrysotoxum]